MPKKPNSGHPSKTSPNHSLVSHQQFSYYQGPFPPPDSLRQYEQLVSGSAEKIFNLFEAQAMHRMALEKSVISADIRDGNLGLWFGFIVAISAIIAGVFCILNGREISGTLLSGGALIGLVGTFVYGSRERRKERETKAKST